MTPDERARAVAALIAERFGLPTPPPRPRVQTSAAGASNPGGAPYSLTEMPQMSILIVTEADVEAEAARTHGRAWPHMDAKQCERARESARKALVWAAYPKLVAAYEQLQAELATERTKHQHALQELDAAMGQAEELHATLERVDALTTDTDCTPLDPAIPLYVGDILKALHGGEVA